MVEAPDLTPEELFAAFEAMDLEDQVRTRLWYRKGVFSDDFHPILCFNCNKLLNGDDEEEDNQVWIKYIKIDHREFSTDLEVYCQECMKHYGAFIDVEQSAHPCMSYSNIDGNREHLWRQIGSTFESGSAPGPVDGGSLMHHYLVVPAQLASEHEGDFPSHCLSGECYVQTFGDMGGSGYEDSVAHDHQWPIEVTFCTCFDGSEPNKFVTPLADNFSGHHWEGWEDEFNQALESSSREDLEALIEECKEVLQDRKYRSRNQLPSVGGGGYWGESWSNLELLIHTIETLIEKKEDSWGPVDNESLKDRLDAMFEQWTKPTFYDCPECGAEGGRDWGPEAPCRTPEGEITKPHENRRRNPDDEFAGLGSLFL